MAQQPDFLSLIREKNNRLDSVPGEFISRVKKTERQIYQGIIELLGQLEMKGGRFLPTPENIRIASLINEQIKVVLVGSDYTKAVSLFAQEFDIQADLNSKYFTKAFELQTSSEAAAAQLLASKKSTIDLLLNRGADSKFIAPLQNIIEQSVYNNAGYADALQAIRDFVDGTDDRDSRLLRYSSEIAYDSFAVSDAAYTSIYSEEIGAEWFFYSGGLIDSSRAFCKERSNQYFHYKEIEAWGNGKKTAGMQVPDSEGNWNGKILGTTDATIWSYRGGYRCGHTFMPVSVTVVPIKVLMRNIEQGFFAPSEREMEVLGI